MKTDYDQKIAEKILQIVHLEEKEVLEIGCGNGCITLSMSGGAVCRPLYALVMCR